jgi:neutral ceramidase
VRRALVVLLALLVVLAPAAPADGQQLLAGVGRADITPPTGYPLGGYTRADRTGQGVHTRLEATALVLQRGDRKVALVAMDLFMIAGGMVKEAAERNADLGFGEHNVLVSASHTHSGPGGFANFKTFNTVAPSMATTDRPETFVELLQPKPADPQLYTFLTGQLAKAIRMAAHGARPAVAGWGDARLTDVTKNRSVEAHLADHGIIRDRGAGSAADDPDGAEHTIDPDVHVLRVDRVVTRRSRRGKRRRVRIPLGGWSLFANHGTVVPATYQLYNEDHHGAAIRMFERRVRRAGRVPATRLVVNVYGNSNEGDQSAALDGQSIERAEVVGRREADAMFDAWRRAGRSLTSRPALDLRWTRVCFCGQDLGGGRTVSDEPVPGLPFLTGSEEERGPLYDITGVPFEDRRSAVAFDSQGHKIGFRGAASTETVPTAVPLFTVRVRDRMIASMPGEPTVEVGRRVERAVLAAAGGAGVRDVVVAGLAGEFVQYLTTPEEYERQHYEGGSTLYGMYAALHLEQQLAGLAGGVARGEPAPEPYPFDPRNGVRADAAPFGTGAASATAVTQPGAVDRGSRVSFVWQGGPGGFDRPLERPFVTIERRVRGRWRHADDDLWLHTAWRVERDGKHTATWTPQRDAPPGVHRFVITANRYRLASAPFNVR